MTLPITNLFDEITQRPRLDAERRVIHAGENGWMYAHHPNIAWFRGRFIVVFSNGRHNEDDVGQGVMFSTSGDFACWSDPEPLMDMPPGREVEPTLSPGGLHHHGGTLVAYVGQYEYDPDYLVDGHRAPGKMPPDSHLGTTLVYVASTDGERWSEPVDLGLPMVPNHGPEPTSTGRLIISGNTMFPHTDDPEGITGWTKAGIYPPEIEEEVVDDSAGFGPVAERAGWPTPLCEGSFYETDDAVIHMLLRSRESRLWHAESRDDGETWSAPAPTEFTDNLSKFHVGRLPDGRFYHVGNPDPTPKGARPRLILSVSEDGRVFDRQYVVADEPYERKAGGLHKHGQYGYPHSMIHADRMHIVVSRCKEAIEVFRIPLSSI